MTKAFFHNIHVVYVLGFVLVFLKVSSVLVGEHLCFTPRNFIYVENIFYSNKECPTCRKKLVSKRSLRPDPNFDALIS